MRVRAEGERLAHGACAENLRGAFGKRAKLGPARQCGQKESVP